MKIFKGSFSDFRVWSCALSAEEIASLQYDDRSEDEDEDGCTELSGVQRNLCEWHDVAGMGSDAAGLDACRAWCDAEASCFAIQWVPGEGWCNPCTGWANDQGVDSLGSWAATSGDAEVQSKECWQRGATGVSLFEDKSRGVGCDALDSSGNVVDANSADHCCQNEDYCCDHGSLPQVLYVWGDSGGADCPADSDIIDTYEGCLAAVEWFAQQGVSMGASVLENGAWGGPRGCHAQSDVTGKL